MGFSWNSSCTDLPKKPWRHIGNMICTDSWSLEELNIKLSFPRLQNTKDKNRNCFRGEDLGDHWDLRVLILIIICEDNQIFFPFLNVSFNFVFQGRGKWQVTGYARWYLLSAWCLNKNAGRLYIDFEVNTLLPLGAVLLIWVYIVLYFA